MSSQINYANSQVSPSRARMMAQSFSSSSASSSSSSAVLSTTSSSAPVLPTNLNSDFLEDGVRGLTTVPLPHTAAGAAPYSPEARGELENFSISDDVNTVDADGLTVNAQLIAKTRGGKPRDYLWSHFSDHPEAPSLQMLPCKHCNDTVVYCKHIDTVRTHMSRCRKYQAWLRVERNKVLDPVGLGMPTEIPDVRPAKQQRIHMCPKVTVAEQKSFNRKYAMHYFMTGMPFIRAADPYLAESLNFIRPGLLPPNRKALASTLLDEAYDTVESMLKKFKSSNPYAYCCLSTDSFTDINRNTIVTYNTFEHGKSFFHESVATKLQRHNSVWLSADVERVMANIDPVQRSPRVVGLVTDNTSANKSMWKILKRKYPSKFFFGCVSHVLHLIVKRLFHPSKDLYDDLEERRATRMHTSTHTVMDLLLDAVEDDNAGEEYDDNTEDLPQPSAPAPAASRVFTELQVFTKNLSQLQSFMKNHQVDKARLETAQEEANVKKLAKIGLTRWGSTKACYDTCYDSREILYNHVSTKQFMNDGDSTQKRGREKIRQFVTAGYFETLLLKGKDLLEPLDELIVKYQKDRVPISSIWPDFFNLKARYEAMTTLTRAEKDYVLGVIAHYWNFLVSDAHMIAYMLDPRWIGENLSLEQRTQVESFITQYPLDDGVAVMVGSERHQTLRAELTKYMEYAKGMKVQNHEKYLELIAEKNRVHPRSWWALVFDAFPTLGVLALKIFSLHSTSANCERTFSTIGFIHNKLRNCLGDEKVRKLTYIRSNALTLFPNKVIDVDDDCFDPDLEQILNWYVG